MKKKLFLFGIVTAACFASCSDDDMAGVTTVENPVQTGDEIIFGSSVPSSDTPESRTEYGERTSTGIPVKWVQGDQVAIFCLQSSQPADHLVNYEITPQEGENANKSQLVTKVNPEEAGLQWGTQDEHRFYAFYPASAVKGSEEENQTGMITANIPVNQQPVEWKDGTMTVDGKEVPTHFGLPNMNLAYMYAHTKVLKSKTPVGTPISLEFKNLVTVLDITVQGPKEGGSPVTVSNININAVGGKNIILTGDFTCNIREAGDNTDEVSAECTAAGDLNEVRNRISIPCYDSKTKDFITLNAGENLNVKAYIIPDNDEGHTISPRELQITVSITNGAAKRKLLQKATVTPHKVNRVILPHLTSGGTNYWLSDLDPNIYASELSLPGSKMSVLTSEYNSNLYYQTASIEDQFDDGVRAFILQTQRNWHVEWSNSRWRLEVVVNGQTAMPLQDALTTISKKVKAAHKAGHTNEFAFVLVTWNRGMGSDADDWLKLLADNIDSWATELNIYPDRITPETTLGDLGGHLLIKANTNASESDMDSALGAGDEHPMLFSSWTSAMPEDNLPLRWGTSNPNASYNMYWYAQELTSVGNGGLGSVEDKNKYVRQVFERGVDIYLNNDQHDTWLMNDLGGYYTAGYGEERVTKLTTDMNNLGIQLLQERTQNAGMGLVFMNFADKNEGSGVAYRSDDLIQTIIDNNFKFQLRKKGSTSAAGSRSNAAGTSSYNANSWDK